VTTPRRTIVRHPHPRTPSPVARTSNRSGPLSTLNEHVRACRHQRRCDGADHRRRDRRVNITSASGYSGAASRQTRSARSLARQDHRRSRRPRGAAATQTAGSEVAVDALNKRWAGLDLIPDPPSTSLFHEPGERARVEPRTEARKCMFQADPPLGAPALFAPVPHVREQLRPRRCARLAKPIG
jgi:hypothetical protein